MNWLRNFFGRHTPERLASDQLDEARLLALEHRKQAELNTALADAYDAQAKRLQGEIG